ncbi:MAG: oxygen-independent coproporphyrinogen III oxidase-like protein [Betaproteobacteria bacterium]|nr:oxygen-independent coproporphyrinogen III oxidase-like protein [Betaproteobacteria bacterium]NBY13968.1 oxygen-independent coproporphyrinogen III oxidase-like protein [Betaproteobacteria bacterium]
MSVPLSLYVHMPWCVRKCPYCDFNSHALRHPTDPLPESAYGGALIRDLEHALPLVWGRSVSSVFFGGGTPSLFSATAIGDILQAVRARLRLLPGAEVTLEANPGSADSARFAGYRSAGITRLSVGVQTFHDTHLRSLGRIHDSLQARRAVELALESFEHVNLDLMYGLEGQTLQEACLDLEQAIELDPGHISLYQLTIEPNTFFAHQPPRLPDDDSIWEMQQALHALLARAGYERVEVSAFARRGHACLHNVNYWEFGDYLGIGAGAHSKLTLPERGVIRQTCLRTPADYLESVGSDAHRKTSPVAAEQLPFEFMLNAMRLVEGVPVSLYAERTGRPTEDLLEGLSRARQRGLIEEVRGRMRPTPRGLDFLNDLQSIFLH